MKEKSPDSPKPATLTDDDMTSVDLDRRVFLSKLGVRSSALVGALLLTSACGDESDKCDTDTQTDIDPFDPISRKKDRCDSD